VIRPRLVLVTDPRYDDDHLVRTIDRVLAAVPDDSLLVQVRAKSEPLDVQRRIAARVRATGAPFVINGDPEEARLASADGVHLAGPTPDVAGARRIVGHHAFVSVAAHDDDAVRRAIDAGATAALVSPIFEVEGKGAPRGVSALESARAITGTRCAIFALGGVDSRRAASCAAAGASGAAVIRAVFDAADPGAEAVTLVEAFSRW